eukprot:m.64555 g.64555  ORF g.64555 m.64555 type:complete len:347 (-) comp11493_c1_seq1:128-1168(-)
MTSTLATHQVSANMSAKNPNNNTNNNKMERRAQRRRDVIAVNRRAKVSRRMSTPISPTSFQQFQQHGENKNEHQLHKCLHRRACSDSKLFMKVKHDQDVSGGLTLSAMVRVVNAKTTDERFNDSLRKFILQRNVWDQVNDTLMHYKAKQQSVKGVVLTQHGDLHDERNCTVCKEEVEEEEEEVEDECDEDGELHTQKRSTCHCCIEKQTTPSTTCSTSTSTSSLTSQTITASASTFVLPTVFEREEEDVSDCEHEEEPSQQRICVDGLTLTSSETDEYENYNGNSNTIFHHETTPTTTTSTVSRVVVNNCVEEYNTNIISALDISHNFPAKKALMMSSFRKRTVSF